MLTVLLALAATTSPAEARPMQFAQEAGMLEGVVTGVPTGLALPNVAVTLRPADEPWYLVHTTGADGTFRFSDLPAGVYILHAQQPGYVDAMLSSVVVVPGVPVSEHLQMDVSESPPPTDRDRRRAASSRKS